jgi:hypothetical protein
MVTFTIVNLAIVYWVALWGLVSHLVDFLTGGNLIKEIVVYSVMLILVYIYSKINPEIMNNL